MILAELGEPRKGAVTRASPCAVRVPPAARPRTANDARGPRHTEARRPPPPPPQPPSPKTVCSDTEEEVGSEDESRLVGSRRTAYGARRCLPACTELGCPVAAGGTAPPATRRVSEGNGVEELGRKPLRLRK